MDSRRERVRGRKEDKEKEHDRGIHKDEKTSKGKQGRRER